ncbi:hypothetical protein BH18ACT4_BH18ACT4_08700 [soil metagenome]
MPDVFVRDLETGAIELISVSSTGEQGNLFSSGPSISDDGRFVAFSSFSSTLVPGDTNANVDVFLHDRATGANVMMSVSAAGEPGNGLRAGPAINADGRYVAFFSEASNLVPGDTNETRDIFVRDVVAGTTERVNVSSTEEEANAQSGFSVHGGSSVPTISADGRYVGFDSFATNLVPGDTNDSIDVFRRDRVNGTTERLSVDSQEVQGNDDSSDTGMDASGLVVAFISMAQNLVPDDTNTCIFFTIPGQCPDVFVRDDTGTGPPPAPEDADPSVVLSDRPDPVAVGSSLSYSVVVTNQGASAARRATLTVELAREVRIVRLRTDTGTCTAAAKSITGSLGARDPGESATGSSVVQPRRPGALTVTASVAASEADPTPADNTDVETTTVVSASIAAG